MSTNPEAEVQTIEDRFAKALGEEPEIKQPESEAADAPAETETDETVEEAPEGQAETVEEDTEEVEFEGKTYALPKELKAAVLMQKDYTQKTQAVAEQRRELEQRQQELQRREQFSEKAQSAAVQLGILQQQLQQFQTLDWDTLARTDQAEFLRLDRAQRQLYEQFTTQQQSLQHAYAEHEQLTASEQQQRLERGRAELARDIPGWNTELARALTENGKNYGFSEAELSQVIDPRHVKVLHDAYQWRKLQQSKPAIQKRVAEVKPVSVKTSRSAQPNQAAVKEQDVRARLKKTGSTADAEEAFYQRLIRRK